MEIFINPPFFIEEGHFPASKKFIIAVISQRTTPLYSAAVSRTPENIQVLLKAGADVMARNEDGWTPLHLAAGYGEKAGVIEALLEAGADPKRNNQNGKTPWDLAQDNDKLKDTKSYWALNDARYN